MSKRFRFHLFLTCFLLLLSLTAGWIYLTSDQERNHRDSPEVSESAKQTPDRSIQQPIARSNNFTGDQRSEDPVSPGQPSSGTGPVAPPAIPASTRARAVPDKSVASLLQGVDLSNPEVRSRVVAEMEQLQQTQQQAVEEKALRLGVPLRIDGPGHKVAILYDFRGDEPLYRTNKNQNAAISTGANLLLSSPYNLGGTGIKVGVWDGGSVRSTHQELTGRVTKKNPLAVNDDHATHVAGTIAASGVQIAARGMAPLATIDSYDWEADYAEMTATGTVSATDGVGLPLSNHSYGYDAATADMGRYETEAASVDAIAASLPYYLPFWAAGNEQDVLTNKGGFQSITFNGLAKNIMTIGAVNDAVSAGVRNIASATIASFSSLGPCDDGRIKPDLVANGVGVYSSVAISDTTYDGTYDGTSMATPNALGSAILIEQLYAREFSGQRMRASTLKALLIHTADDRGNTGPDYTYGWGLMNVKAAADLLLTHKNSLGIPKLIEGTITNAAKTVTHAFTWDGVSPIRATLCWTEPAGAEQTSADSRTANLVHNLDARITAPNGTTIHQPYVMPFVGNWSTASMSTPATFGKNNVDTVEQVFIASPSQAGTYTITVSLDGTLTTSNQIYSLVVSGGSDTLPAITSAPSVSSTVNTAFSYQITASNSPISFAASGLPAGLSLNTTTGLISGTPTTTGTSSVTISASNASGQTSSSLSITINSAVITPVVVFSENMGIPSGTTPLANYITGTAPATFQNKGILTYAQGSQANPAEVRSSSSSSGYTGASGNGNIWFTSSGVYGFSIESINASNFTNLSLNFGYRKESLGAHASFSIDYWNGTSWITLANTPTALFNESSTATTGWYLSKSISLPAAAQISGLKIRFVKTGTTAIRIDDVKLTGTLAATPSITVAGTLSAVNSIYGSASSTAASFTVSGSSMNAGILVTPPAGFEVSQTNANSGYAASQTIGTGGTIPATTVHLRLSAGGNAGSYSGNITISSAGASNATLAVPVSEVRPKLLVITAQNRTKPYGTTLTLGANQTNFTSNGLVGAETIGSVTLAAGGGTASTDAPGVYQITPSAAMGGTFTPLNYDINYVAGTLTVTPRSFGSWLSLYPNLPLTGAQDDPDMDGQSNLMEYFCGTHPGSSNTSATSLQVTANVMTYRYRRGKGITGVTGTAQWSSDLTGASWSATGINESVQDMGDHQQVTATINIPAGAPRRFMRLHVSQP